MNHVGYYNGVEVWDIVNVVHHELVLQCYMHCLFEWTSGYMKDGYIPDGQIFDRTRVLLSLYV
jgi:hypothetical protein